MWIALLGLALAAEPIDASSLTWLAGTWVQNRGDNRVEETWTAPDSGTLFGINRTAKSGKTTFHEFLRIEPRESGLTYVALPKGAPQETGFTATEHGPNWVRFENPKHDFPTAITYKRVDDRLEIAVRGPDGKGFDLAMTLTP